MVIKNKYGFNELEEKPSNDELGEYYSKKYYQEQKSTYSHMYSSIELKYIKNKISQKYYAFKDLLVNSSKHSLLDIGCGEGFCMKYFMDMGWDVTGCDYSEYGIKTHNPACSNNILVGNIYDKIEALIAKSQKFDVIWLDNVLEHVLDPLGLLIQCRKLSKENGILIIEVPNDFSALQRFLYSSNIIHQEFWIAIPDHISYFNKEGLEKICSEAGWRSFRILSDFPIDFNLANQDANYVTDRTKGKEAHIQRILLDNLFSDISIEKTNRLYEALADLGLGRQIIGIFTSNF